MSTLQQEPVKSPLASAILNFFCIVVLAISSLATFAYTRSVEPLYGSAALSWHLNKIVWAACILGTFAPTISILPAIFAGGMLLAAMPMSSYWVAALTARAGDVIWGPVITHVTVLMPVLYLAAALVKALQEAPDQNGVAAAASMIGLPVCRMAIMSLQDVWPVIPYVKNMNEAVILQYLGSFAVTVWVISPFLMATPSAPISTEDSAAVPSGNSKSNKKGPSSAAKKNAAQKKPADTSSPQKNSKSSQNHGWRIMILPTIPLMMNFGPSPTLDKPLPAPWNHPTAPLRVLSSVRSSYSGIVLVGDILSPRTPEEAANITYPHSLRYLRAGHSLLGGVWTEDRAVARDGSGPLSKDANGIALGDSIYSTFVMQEAAKLVVQPDGGAPKSALTIGLGTGIAASAFIRHGISTTVVEIDPAVYEAAKQYFGLAPPEPERLFLEDARRWVRRRKFRLNGNEDDLTAEDKELFDVVIHDCFSGGSVPGHLFTVDFWDELKGIMKATGVVAVNFAGKLGSDSSRGIVTTLNKAFGRCRAFHDSMETLSEEQLSNDFINWVFFCTPSTDPINFHSPKESDFLNSYLRERVLMTLPEREIDVNRISGEITDKEHDKYVLTDVKNPLLEWQQKDALHHWKVMREVLPDVFWETF